MSTASVVAWRQPRVKLALGAVVGVLLGIVLAVTIGGVPWRDYVRRQPPAVVALSFANPSSLPGTAQADGTVHFRFSVENRQNRSYDASYTTSVVDTVTNVSQIVNTAKVSIAAGASATVDGEAVVSGVHRQEVVVRLASGQSIDFYVTPAGSVATK